MNSGMIEPRKPEVPSKDPEVNQQIGRSIGAIDSLVDRLSELISRLEPVLGGQQPPTKDESKLETLSAPLAEQIRQKIYYQIRSQVERIEDTINRLEI